MGIRRWLAALALAAVATGLTACSTGTTPDTTSTVAAPTTDSYTDPDDAFIGVTTACLRFGADKPMNCSAAHYVLPLDEPTIWTNSGEGKVTDRPCLPVGLTVTSKQNSDGSWIVTAKNTNKATTILGFTPGDWRDNGEQVDVLHASPYKLPAGSVSVAIHVDTPGRSTTDKAANPDLWAC